MRTTLSIDDDVLLAVKERARREKRTAGEILSDLARQALTNQNPQPAASQEDAFMASNPCLIAVERYRTR